MTTTMMVLMLLMLSTAPGCSPQVDARPAWLILAQCYALAQQPDMALVALNAMPVRAAHTNRHTPQHTTAAHTQPYKHAVPYLIQQCALPLSC